MEPSSYFNADMKQAIKDYKSEQAKSTKGTKKGK